MTSLPKPVKSKRAPKPIQRTSRPRKRRKGRKASLGRLADALWSRLVKLPGRCEVCGSTERLQAGHGFSRRYRNTRWLPINGFCLCSKCHVSYTFDPLAWDDYLRKAWADEVYWNLRERALAYGQKYDLPAIVANLEAELVRRGAF